MPNTFMTKIANVGRSAVNWGLQRVGGFAGALKGIDRIGQMATMQIPLINSSPIDLIPLNPEVKAKVKALLGGVHLANQAVESAQGGDMLSAGTNATNLLGKASAYMTSGQTGFGSSAPALGW